jgi:16S rRNA (guanine1207-N2)-methyltransferase
VSEQQHYFSSQPDVASERRVVRVELDGVRLDLVSDVGVFSARRLDPGTRVLLEKLPSPPEHGELLDLGCGYGPIALIAAMRSPQARVWAVDVNERALELVRENASAAGLGNVVAALPDEVPDDVRFAAIYSNPPIRIGKDALHALMLRWLRRLDTDGEAHFVVQRNLGADSLAAWLCEHGLPTTRAHSRKGYRILVTRSAA